MEGSNQQRIVLISCVSKKRTLRSKAKDLYISDWFHKAYIYAILREPNAIYVLSAKYGLVSIEEEIEPYDLTLNKMTVKERKLWSECLLHQLQEVANLQQDHFILLAGIKYRKFLIPRMVFYEIPMKGLGIGSQKAWLKQRISP